MRFGVLGPLAVWSDRDEPVTVPGRKVRALLADLLVHVGRPVSVDRLVDDLWGDGVPADPTAALHVRVSQLRRALANAEPEARSVVVSQPPGYALHVDGDAVDAARFAALTGRAQVEADPRNRARLLGEALDLWRGPALADFADEPFAQVAVARWEENRLAAVEAHVEARLELGEHDEMAAELGEHVARQPYRERLRAAHMRALFRSGRAGEALDSFQELRTRLADELGLDPGPELAALQQAILTNDPAEGVSRGARPPARPARPSTNLPAPVTKLIGREHALEQVRELLSTGRLVTITGPGGVGKTSMAVAVAATVATAYPDGVWLVDLTGSDAMGDPAEMVLSALAVPDAAGTPESPDERLVSVLAERQTLLVLDNCEHMVVPVAELIGRLLAAAPGLRVLATSREPLRLRGEQRYDLLPLPVPDTDHAQRLAESPAVQLFLTRAGLAPSGLTIAAAAEVCRRLDGIPLALELAATRAKAVGVTELAARLRIPGDRFGVLGTGPRDAPARQRTLAAVIDWSWRLLTDAEQSVLRRLTVHSGGCTLAAAEAVCAGDGVADGDVLDLLAGLVDRSLVVRIDGGDVPRFRLLESVSAYCLDRLREAGEEPALRRRHADYYLALAERADPPLRGPDQLEWLVRLDAEIVNLRAATDEYRRENAAEHALRLTLALVWYRFLRGRLTEGRRALAAALEVDGEACEALRARAEIWCAGLAVRQGEAGVERVTAALDNLSAVDDAVERARVGWFLATATLPLGDEATSGEILERSLETFRAAGDEWGEAAALSSRAMLAHMRNDVAGLERDARRSAELFGKLGDDWGTLQATDWMIGLADLSGDQDEGKRLCRDGLAIAEDLGLWIDVAGRLSWLAWFAVQSEEYALARDHAEDARRLAAEHGDRPGEVFATMSLAFAARRDGKFDLAEDHLRWLLDSARQQQADEGHPPYLSIVLDELGLSAAQRGDPAAALEWLTEGFDVHRVEGWTSGEAWALTGMAFALVQDGRARLAAQLLGAADASRQEFMQRLSPSDRTELDRISAAVRESEPDFDVLFARGRQLTLDQARSLLGGDRA